MRYLGSSSILAVLMAYAGSAAAQTQQTTQVSPDQSDCASIPGQATTAECAGSADAGQRTNSDLAAESPSPTAATGSDDIIVTGSRLNSGFASPTPVTVTTTSDLRAAAPASLTDAITQLPQFRNSSRASTAGPSGVRGNGASFLSLRGLEPQRTLTLLDGRRVVASSAAGSPDINLFPQDLISRVEVVTGGASAAYGSDAVAGVVNFILDKNFTGVRARVQAGISDEGDGGSRQAALSYGASLLGDRVHFIASAEYRATDEIPGAHSRPWADAAYAIIVNPNAPPARLIAPTVASNATFGGLIVGGPLANTQFLPGGVSAPFRFGTAVTSTTMIGGDGAPSQFGFTSGLESYSIFGRVTAEASESLSIFFEGSGARSTSGYDVSRSSQTAGTAFTIFADNAYLPQDIQAALARTGTTSFRLARVDRDFGFSRVAARSDTWRVAGGFDAKLGGDWHLEGYASHGANDYEVDTYNNPIYRRLFAAADAVVDPATKRIVCRSTLQGYDPGCVPVNLFGDGSVSAEARDYFMGVRRQHQWHRFEVVI